MVSRMQKDASSGFTLLEVMVSLAVLSIALSAIVRANTTYTSNLGYLRDKTLAHWVAVNKMNEITLTNTWPEPGVKKGSTTMAKRNWAWRVDTQNTPDSSVRRLEIEIRYEADDEDPLTTLTGFAGQP